MKRSERERWMLDERSGLMYRKRALIHYQFLNGELSYMRTFAGSLTRSCQSQL